MKKRPRIRRLIKKSDDQEFEQLLIEQGKSAEGFPCVHIAHFAQETCDQHPDPWECSHRIIVQLKNGEFGIPIKDGGSSYVKLNNCPWCGCNLFGTRHRGTEGARLQHRKGSQRSR